MKQRPILFSTPMVQAILEGRKTVTRRVCNDQSGAKCFEYGHDWERKEYLARCPYGKPGDILWVREAWRYAGGYVDNPNYTVMGVQNFVYKADEEWNGPWKPSIHMPKAACRLRLKIITIRVERLQEISEADAIKEGVMYYGEESNDYKNYLYNDKYGDDWGVLTAKESFKTLWQSLNGLESWDENPWVWVIEFEKI